MRRLLAALGLIGLISPAFAADYELPALRGSQMFVPAYPTYFSWQGFYAGGQVSFTSASSDFTRATEPMVAFSLRQTVVEAVAAPSQWAVLGGRDTGAGGFGGFLGYNLQWDNAVVGFEFNYTHSSLDLDATSSPISRQASAGQFTYDVTLDATGSLRITDFATTRARFGWVVDNFMPYATVGLAFGRADVALSTVVSGFQIGPPPANPVVPFAFSQSQTKSGAYMYGYSGSAGVDYALTSGIFARAEYEYIHWHEIFNIASSMHNFRAGLGVKF
jgi:outer membrane immunogenic protein